MATSTKRPSTKRRRRRRRTKADLLREAEMRTIDERIAVATFYDDVPFGGELEDWLSSVGSL